MSIFEGLSYSVTEYERREDRGKQEERRQKAERRRVSALDTEEFCAHRTGC